MTLEQTPEEITLDADAAAAGTAAVGVATTLERAAETVGATVTESVPAALAGAMDKIASQQSRIVQLVEAGNNSVSETLNALSRAISNTDISAQAAAEHSENVEEAIAPQEDTEPDQGARPADLKELPKQETAKEQNSTWWFGKAIRRHGGKL